MYCSEVVCFDKKKFQWSVVGVALVVEPKEHLIGMNYQIETEECVFEEADLLFKLDN